MAAFVGPNGPPPNKPVSILIAIEHFQHIRTDSKKAGAT